MSDPRFWARVRKTDGCWEWTGAKGEGYGRLGRVIGGHAVFFTAHRYSYELANGPIPSGLLVRHTCHNRACVRPDHLVLGTYLDNGADTARSGRARNQWTGKRAPEPMPIAFFEWCAGGAA
jgi:hypothetical protein